MNPAWSTRIIIIIGIIAVVGVVYFLRPKAENSVQPIAQMPLQTTQSVAVPTDESMPAEEVNPITARKLLLLDAILASHNDNDPRLDSEFKNLSSDEKIGLIQRYQAAVPEALNERGTLVFLVGREAKNEKDLSFLQSVLVEKPCLSLANCKQEAQVDPGADDTELDHGNLGASTTLVYPQMVAVEMLKRSVIKGNLSKASVQNALERAKRSESPRVVAAAEAALEEIGESP